MAWATAGEIISDAAVRLGLVPAAIADPYAETDENIVRLCSLFNQVGRDLVGARDWGQLTEEHTFATAAGVPNYDTPPGFRRVLEQTAWNRDQGQEMQGPLTAQQWQTEKGLTASSAYQSFRIWQDEFWIHPTPASIETIAYEYVSAYWVAGALDTEPTKALATLPDDIAWLDRDLLTWALRLAFKQATGQPTDADQRGYEDALSAALSDDGAAPVLCLVGPHEINVLYARAPDSGWST